MSFFSEALWVLLLGSLLGLELIGKVPPTLHTPLMSGANAISGIAVIGTLLAVKAPKSPPIKVPQIIQIQELIEIPMAVSYTHLTLPTKA